MTAPSLEFRHDAACRRPEYDADWWTSVSEQQRGWARYVCLEDCPVRAACKTWAHDHPQMCDGAVWGGEYWTSGHGSRVYLAGRQPPVVPPDEPPYGSRKYFRFDPHAQRIRRWLDDGLSLGEVARLLQCNYKSLSKWLVRQRGFVTPGGDHEAAA